MSTIGKNLKKSQEQKEIFQDKSPKLADISSNFEAKCVRSKYDSFSKEWDTKWDRYFPDKNDLKNQIMGLEYGKFYDVNNAFGKLNKALQICAFLHKLSKSKSSQDTEKIIITILVSCAEAIYRINKPDESISEHLVKGFFKSVKKQLKIKGRVGKEIFEPAEVLYLVRNDYIHNGNFTGSFFKKMGLEDYVCNWGSFYYSKKEDKLKLIQVYSECKLTYQDFLKIFLEAFIKNIEKYCEKK